MTRARDRLYIAGVKPARQGYKGSWHDTLTATFERLDGTRTIETADGPVLRFGEEPQETTRETSTIGAGIEPPAWAMRPARQERAAIRRTPSALLSEEAASLPVLSPASLARDPFLRGRAIHKLLQILPELAREERQAAAERLLALAPYRALDDEKEEIIREVISLLENSSFASVFGPGSRAEVPISGVLMARTGERLFISGQIDRLLVSAREIHIIDFKTNRPAPAKAAQVPRPYHAQMAAYARLLGEALPGRDIKAALLFTAAPRLIPLDLTGIDVTEVTATP
jgi:ATP-dependent helicase/nuclease subunit A